MEINPISRLPFSYQIIEAFSISTAKNTLIIFALRLNVEPHTGFSIGLVSLPRLHYACRGLFNLNPILGTA